MYALYVDPKTKQGFGFGCHTCSDPASRTQTQKIIRNLVRQNASLYTDSLATANVYNGENTVAVINWNQMSDRNNAHIQKNVVSSRGSSTKGSITRCRPGASSPGGAGVDVKHGSYDRYLARVKGKSCSKNMLGDCNKSASYESAYYYTEYEFTVGQKVWALQTDAGPFYAAVIDSIVGDVYTIFFLVNDIPDSANPYLKSKNELLIYMCDC